VKSQPDKLRDRTKHFAIEVVKLVHLFWNSDESRFIGRQLMHSVTSVAANYRAVCRARSKAEFIAKIGIVVEEIDKTSFWLKLISNLNILSPDKTSKLLKEANELIAIFSASNQTERGYRKQKKDVLNHPNHLMTQFTYGLHF
jgi:four helix bundle protein